MSIFIRKLISFIAIFIILAVAIVGVSNVYMNNVQFKIDKSKNILVIGDSHTECAIDDSSFKRCANFSKSATSFVYSYAALRKLVHDNPQIDTVLLSYHSSSLLYEREQGWIFDEVVMSTQVPVFLPYFTACEFYLFLTKPEFYKMTMQMPLMAYDYYSAVKNGGQQDWIDRNIGNFRDLSWSNFSRDTAAARGVEDFTERLPVSKISLNYIFRIADFCKEKGIKLILFNAPVYQFKKYVNYVEFEENRKKYLKDIPFVDYAQFQIADSCRFDIWHLNGIGAREFSRYLDSNLVNDIKILP